MTSTEDITKAVQGAQRYLGDLPAPPNEANTCDWVIRPLLLAIGYENHEVHSQSGDVANKYPDYTVLPGTPHTWYLEAKAWSAALESLHVDQALNYAHSNGQRWVVLSNGKEWRLYDDRFPGKSADRLVATARLEETAALVRFLAALSRASIMAQKVEAFANERRVRQFLTDSLHDPSSPVVQAVVKAVRQHVGNGPVSAELVVEVLRGAELQTMPVERTRPNPCAAGEGTFVCTHRGLVANAKFDGTSMTVLAGSQFSKNPVPSNASTHSKQTARLLQEGAIVDRGTHFEVVNDMTFKSPSGPADLVYGRSTNSWEWWKDANGKTINEIFRKSLG